MLLVIGTIRLPPEKLREARPAMRDMILGSRAEEGCHGYSYSEDVLEPGLIHVNEVWRDQAALDAHFASDHIAVWRATWFELGITDRNLFLYEVGAQRRI